MKTRFSLIVFIALLICGIRIQGADTANAPRRVEITAQRWAFDPRVVTLTKGDPVVLEVKSKDVQHGLTFQELGLQLKVPKGGSSELRFTPDRDGDFVGHCSVFCGAGHGRMTITLHVVG